MRRLERQARRAPHHRLPQPADAGLGPEPRPVRPDGPDRLSADDTLGALAQRTGLDQSTLSRNLQVLEASGLIEIAAGDKDARRRAVWLTEKGALSLEASLADWRRAHGELAERIDPEAARGLALAAEALEEG